MAGVGRRDSTGEGDGRSGAGENKSWSLPCIQPTLVLYRAPYIVPRALGVTPKQIKLNCATISSRFKERSWNLCFQLLKAAKCLWTISANTARTIHEFICSRWFKSPVSGQKGDGTALSGKSDCQAFCQDGALIGFPCRPASAPAHER